MDPFGRPLFGPLLEQNRDLGAYRYAVILPIWPLKSLHVKMAVLCHFLDPIFWTPKNESCRVGYRPPLQRSRFKLRKSRPKVGDFRTFWPKWPKWPKMTKTTKNRFLSLFWTNFDRFWTKPIQNDPFWTVLSKNITRH